MREMIVFKPDGGNMGHKSIRLKRKPGRRGCGCTLPQKSCERGAVIDLKRTAFDAASFWRKFNRCQSTRQCGDGDNFRRGLCRSDGVQREVTDGFDGPTSNTQRSMARCSASFGP
jgi:hypothetical protein